jgi:hypothetical protein
MSQRGIVSYADAGQPLMAYLAKAVALGEDPGEQLAVAERLNMPHAVTKALQAPMLTGDSDMQGLANTTQILTSFVPMLRSSSAFFRLLDGMMLKFPLRTRATWLTGAAALKRVNEGEVIGVSRIATDQSFIEPFRATGILVFSKELLGWLSTAGEAWVSMELRRAIAASVDVGFLDLISDGSTPTRPSVGSSPEAAVSDLKFLLDSTELKADSRPLFVMAPDVARRAATLYDNALVFPGMSATGGTLLNTPAMACDAMDAGTIGLIDGAAIAGDAEGVKIKSARHATVQMNNIPDSPPTSATTLINLWQANLVGLMPEIYFGAARLRASAFATVTGVAWGETDSPA